MKRLLDATAAAAGLLLAAPLLLAVACAVRMTMGGPVLFRQQRPGLHGAPFNLLKFRTMRPLRPGEDAAATDALRLTGLGRRLRATSLDELPTLWNVLTGDMSLVGPRPLLMQYLPRYSPHQARRHEVKPGITGWAQINGRNALSWEEKFACDVWYVDHRSLWLDLKILLLTVWKVLRREGISHAGEATMPEFTGSRHDGD
jgi:lipopolysaccharide/colanic/teichoic acid biosynthesis glycosyltransferase